MSVVGISGAFASPAFASFTGIKCTTLSGNIASTVTLSGCNGNTGGSSQPLLATSLASGGTITWSNTQTTTVTLTVSSPTGGTCPAHTTLEEAKGKSTADTTGSAPVGGKVKVFVCLTSAGALSLEPGHVAKIG
jgi:hypothetical protein